MPQQGSIACAVLFQSPKLIAADKYKAVVVIGVVEPLYAAQISVVSAGGIWGSTHGFAMGLAKQAVEHLCASQQAAVC